MTALVTKEFIGKWRKILVDTVCFTAPEDIDNKVELRLADLIQEVGEQAEEKEKEHQKVLAILGKDLALTEEFLANIKGRLGLS